jgi:hypothetical protein
MITEIGNSDPALEQRFELRLFDTDGNQIATFKESTFKKVEVLEDVQHVPYCEALLATDASNAKQLVEAGTHAQVGRVVEVWAAGRGEPLTLLIRASVDFVRIRSGQEVENEGAELEFQARSVVSPCMDSGFHRTDTGSLADLVKEILSPHNIGSSVDTVADKIDYYVDSESAYAALRLLGLTFNAVVSTSRDGQIAFIDVSTALEKSQKNPVKTFSQDDMLAMQLQQGQPIRKRGQ